MSEEQFDRPPSDGQGGGQQQQQPGGETADVGFAEPDTSAGEQASFEATAEMLSGVPDEVRSAHQLAAEALKGQDRSGLQTVQLAPGQAHASAGETQINAVAIGPTEPGAGEPGKMALHVFTAEESTSEQVRSLMASTLGVQGVEDEQAVPLVTHKASFETQVFSFKIRPAPGGVSVGHYKVTAGTLGCLCIGRSSPRNSRLMILSNNHVVGNSNYSQFGDCVSQPGYYDGGRCPGDQVAITERFVPLRYGGGVNYVDAATAWCWPDRVRRELLYRYGGGLYLYRIGSSPIYPQLGMIVGKSGRTTELTQGRIVYLNWSGWVGGYPGGSAFFSGQFLVQSTTGGTFSAGGDSGSVVWQWTSGLPPVGLLFAGGGGYTICSPMPWVTYLLDVNLYT
jgi:hypothetical protein